MRKGFTRNFEPLRILSDAQVETIHRRTLEVLAETGCKFESEKALNLLKKNGCRIDFEQRIAYFPPDLVENSIAMCPGSFLVRSREPKDNLLIGANTLYFMSSLGARLSDIETGEVRVPTMEENNRAVFISDALESIDLYSGYTPYFEIEGVEPVMLCSTSLAMRLRNSTKITRGTQPTDTFIWETQIAQAAGQELIGNMEAAAPLSYPEDAINAAFTYVEAGFSMYIAAGSVMGGTAPVTIAGSTISNNAELLASVAFIQCIRPGTGIIANDFVTPMNMESGDLFFCSLGASLHQMAFNQMWHDLYKIPTNNTGAAFPYAKKADYQSAYEKTHIAMASALSGANMIVFHGGVTAELSYNPLLAIVDDDIAITIGKTIEGFEISEDTMAVDLIKEVGPVPGTFLNKSHTREWWKKEYFMPKSADRLSYPQWKNSGKKGVLDKARERMEYILATHQVKPLSDSADREIEKILASARKYYRVKGLL
ncbi:MAG: trimethylamine methyltransferase family protein [Actinobacteria bacterium]|nr:trimethylamine methyltransferase family protein [Actinomycetota bacterium]